MVIFSCKDRFEDMMSCIYDAWVYGISVGHEQVRLCKEPVYQQDLFHEYIHVDYDEEKTNKVIRSIQRKISWGAYISVFYACLSIEEDAMQAIYDFLRLGFRVGAQVLDMQNRPEVMRMWELRRRIGNEATYFKEFARFTSMDSKVYLCHIEPKNNVLLLVADHFADRMPSENWVMVDDARRYAVIHPKDEESYVRELSEEEFLALRKAYSQKDEYTYLWKGFFEAIGIKERENRKCQRNMFRMWMRKNVVEFQMDVDK